MQNILRPFKPVNSTHTSFDVAYSGTVALTEIESSNRIWTGGPSGRALRLSEGEGKDYKISMGSSLLAVASTLVSMKVLGGTVEIFMVQPSDSYFSVISSSGGVGTVNVTLGYGQ